MVIDHDTFIFKYVRKECLNDGWYNLSGYSSKLNGNV